MSTMTASVPAPNSEQDRKDANTLRIYRLCDQRTCRKARACRGDPKACLERYLKLVPRGAVMLLVGLRDLRDEGVPFEQALAQLDEEAEAYGAWLTVLDLIDGKPGGHYLIEEIPHPPVDGKSRQASKPRAQMEE